MVERKTLLLLFPERGLGGSLLVQSAGRGFAVLALVLTEADRRYFTNLSAAGKANTAVLVPHESRGQGRLQSLFLGAAPLAQVQAVIAFLGTDWLRMRVAERGADWRIDPDEPAHFRLSLVEEILSLLDKSRSTLWFNLAYGNHRASPEGSIFCNTRYGLTGFLKGIELATDFHNLRTFNICLSYFQHPAAKPRPYHCRHCLTENFVDRRLLKANKENLPSYLLGWIEGKLSEEAT